MNHMLDIVRELEGDTSVSGYRGTTMAFIRFLEVSLGNELVQVGWRLRSTFEAGSEEDVNAFARYAYDVLWPKVSQLDRERLALQAHQSADEYEASYP